MHVPDAPLVGESSVVRAATLDDVDLLVRWHRDPEVARYWDDETYTLGEVQERLTRSDVDPNIVEAGGEPVGYLHAWFEEGVPSVAGLDMFLIPSARGRGIGPDAAETLARWLLDAGGFLRVTADPYLDNERAIRAWEKAGFRPVEEREPDTDHTAPWLLMALAS